MFSAVLSAAAQVARVTATVGVRTAKVAVKIGQKADKVPTENSSNVGSKILDDAIKKAEDIGPSSTKIIDKATKVLKGDLGKSNSGSKDEALNKVDRKQKEIAEAKASSDVQKTLHEIEENTKRLADASEEKIEARDKKQTSFIKASIPDLEEKISPDKKEKLDILKMIMDRLKPLLMMTGAAAAALWIWWEDIQKAGGFMPYIVNKIEKLAGNIWEGILTYIEKAGGWWEWFKTVLNANKDFWEMVGNWLWGFFAKNGDAIIDWLLGFSDTILTFLLGDSWREAKVFWEHQGTAFMIWYDSYALPIKNWFDWINKSGGLGQWMINQMEDWWNTMVLGWGTEWYFPGTLKNLFLTDNASVVTEKTNVRSKEETEENYKRRIANKNYEDKATEIQEGLKNRTQEMWQKTAGNYDQLDKDKKVRAIQAAAKRREKRGLYKPTQKKGRSKYTGANSQAFMKVVTSKYKDKDGIRNGDAHGGVDFRAAPKTQITSITNGVVEKYESIAGSRGGNILVIRDTNGKRILYMHLNSTNVKPGDKVNAGDPIALSGNSGTPMGGGKYAPHVHISVKDGSKTIDPLKYINMLQIAKSSSSTLKTTTNVAQNSTNIKGAPAVSPPQNNDAVIAAALDAQTDTINKTIEEVNSLKAEKATYTLSQGVSDIDV